MEEEKRKRLKILKSKYFCKYVLIPVMKKFSITTPFIGEHLLSAGETLVKWSRYNK